MPSTAIFCGVLLIIVGLGGFGYAYSSLPPGEPVGRVFTALIPAVLGLILAALGLAGKSNEKLRKHVMHVAVVIGLIGFIATVSGIFKIPSLFDGTAARPLAVVSQSITAVVCLVFVVLSVKSFIDARRSGAV